MADQAPPPTPKFKDGWAALPAGMDAGRDPSLIGKDQVALAVNATFRGGFPRTRPYLVGRPLTFTDSEQQDWFENEINQGCYFYSYIAVPNSVVSVTNQGVLVTQIGGRLFSINLDTYRTTEITPNTGRMSRTRNMAYFTQAEQWLVVQDGQTSPTLWDGANSRSAAAGEVPVGGPMAYGQGRLFVIVGNQIMGGDIVGGPGGPNAVITFSERKELTINGDISPSFVIGNAVFLEFIPQQDTATGVGTLLVGGDHGMTSIFAEKPRTEWINGISRVVLFNIGATGHRSPAQINGDIWWRSQPGMRSYRQARAQVGLLGQLPLSTELDPFFKQDTQALLPWCSSVYFDNRLLTTLSPRVMNGRVYFQAIGVADFNVLSSFGQEVVKPAWDGVWTGVNVVELKLAAGRCFAMAIDELGRNCLYEALVDEQKQVADKNLDGTLRPVECQLVSGAYVGQSAGSDVPKKLSGGKFSVRNVRERVEVEVGYRKDGEQCFQDWDTFSFCANTTLCSIEPSTTEPCGQKVANAQYRNPVLLRQPNAERNISSAAPEGAGIGGNNASTMVNGYEFQARYKWTGNLQLRAFTMEFEQAHERATSGCFPPEECSTSQVCCENLFEFTPRLPIYSIPLNPVDPTAGLIAAQIAIINYLGNGLLTPIQDVIDNIPLPDVIPALNDLINTGVVNHPSTPVGGGGGRGLVQII